MIFLVEHFHLSLMRQRRLEVEKQYDGFTQHWSNSMKLFATYWNGRSKCKPEISKTVNEC